MNWKTPHVLDEIKQKADESQRQYAVLVRAVATGGGVSLDEAMTILRSANKTVDDLTGHAKQLLEALNVESQLRDAEAASSDYLPASRELQELEASLAARRAALEAEFLPAIAAAKARMSTAAAASNSIGDLRRQLSTMQNIPGIFV